VNWVTQFRLKGVNLVARSKV